MKYKNTIPYLILQQGGSIKYTKTESQVEIPEIQGYKRQFSIQAPQGNVVEENKSPQVVYIQVPQQQPEQEVSTEEVTENPTSEWSDIRSVIKTNEGFIPVAEKKFKEPSATVGYGFFDRLPDGTKINPGMRITEEQADKQLDIALNKMSSHIQNSLNKYNLKTSKEQFNILLDLGYHGGVGLVDKLLRQSNGDSTKIGSLLQTYATTAKYGDKSVEKGIKDRALRRSRGWNIYTLVGQKGLKIPSILNPRIISDQYNKLADSEIGQNVGLSQKKINIGGKETPVVGGIGILGLLEGPELINTNEWIGLEFPEITSQHFGYNGKIIKKSNIVPNNPTIISTEKLSKPVKSGKTQNMQRHENLDKLVQKFNGDRQKMYEWLKRNR